MSGLSYRGSFKSFMLSMNKDQLSLHESGMVEERKRLPARILPLVYSKVEATLVTSK